MKILRRITAGTTAVVFAVLIAACASQPLGPHDPDAVVRPDLVQPETETVAAGDTLEVTFPEETGRGIAWSLEIREEGDWHLRYFMSANSDGIGGEPSWADAGDEDEHYWIDIGISGSGPDLVPIPETAEPGEYRLCTANSAPNICAEITVSA
ncbi:hypothetical protein [uncultured Agrococcus sp.]|uniref:hypothetical protein n=1 Tax=uncultured Agrococcus sp. TaxID=382258 RepID=UPI0025EFE880|nr:hypothetical protein [uncultured Agrococcus sp.]